MAVRPLKLGMVLVLLALGLSVATTPSASGAGPKFTSTAIVHYPGGVLAKDKDGNDLVGPVVQMFGTGFRNVSEPTIGIAPDGTVYAAAMTKVVSSSDQGATWQDVSAPNHPTTLDPYLYVDPTTGRVFKSDLLGTCQDLSMSDDRGASWTTVPAACNLSDHQTIAAGRPVSSQPVGYPNVVYNCSQSGGYNGYSTMVICDRSLDGGTTWLPTGTPAFHDPSPYGIGENSGDSGVPGHCNGDIGHISVGPDGTLYVPRGWCNQPWLAMSADEGLTWTRTQVASNGMNTTVMGGFGLVMPGFGQSDHEAAAVADANGNLYFLWLALNRLPYLAISRDHGFTWGAPMMIGPPGLTEAWGPALAIDAAGRVSAAYIGTTNSPGAPWTGSYTNALWTGYVSVIDAPLDAKPLIYTGASAPTSHPLVKGACGPDRCDPVLDFIDVQAGPDGSAWASFVDAPKSKELVVTRVFPPVPPDPAILP